MLRSTFLLIGLLAAFLGLVVAVDTVFADDPIGTCPHMGADVQTEACATGKIRCTDITNLSYCVSLSNTGVVFDIKEDFPKGCVTSCEDPNDPLTCCETMCNEPNQSCYQLTTCRPENGACINDQGVGIWTPAKKPTTVPCT